MMKTLRDAVVQVCCRVVHGHVVEKACGISQIAEICQSAEAVVRRVSEITRNIFHRRDRMAILCRANHDAPCYAEPHTSLIELGRCLELVQV